ncbi:hypothetical protein AMAG_02335 [Allomyces macrogynus ATCC 38327]|uniref:Glutathione S-transferase n=1 Tax=Allomyces macrogynus (strain ATCC 38327) TaxID=578462 RepID=A0A0L0S2B0_ALLM3|nr:hypothetical protein AMAG_02335 [Allomyces macrogynus ATCC 38327]|eukprot:KNE56535.1 hypothetical protein AMAG_02335 [Allomyces macrogynus ATCC 38327]
MASPAYTVYYWQIKGRGEMIRLVLEAAGVAYENKYPKEWATEKASLPFGQLPALLITDPKTKQTTTLAQSAAIVRYLARKYNLVAADPLDFAVADSIFESAVDATNAMIKVVWGTPEAEKPAALEKFNTEVLPSFIKAHTAFLEKNGNKGIYVGNKLTYVELTIFNIINELNTLIPDAITAKTAPALWKVRETVANHDKIKAYLASPRLHSK